MIRTALSELQAESALGVPAGAEITTPEHGASTHEDTNNGSLALADALKNYELVDHPHDGRLAVDLTVELISFGFAVEHERVTFTVDAPITGLGIADAILLNATPDQICGNSIDGSPCGLNAVCLSRTSGICSALMTALPPTSTPAWSCWERWWVWNID